MPHACSSLTERALPGPEAPVTLSAGGCSRHCYSRHLKGDMCTSDRSSSAPLGLLGRERTAFGWGAAAGAAEAGPEDRTVRTVVLAAVGDVLITELRPLRKPPNRPAGGEGAAVGPAVAVVVADAVLVAVGWPPATPTQPVSAAVSQAWPSVSGHATDIWHAGCIPTYLCLWTKPPVSSLPLPVISSQGCAAK